MLACTWQAIVFPVCLSSLLDLVLDAAGKEAEIFFLGSRPAILRHHLPSSASMLSVFMVRMSCVKFPNGWNAALSLQLRIRQDLKVEQKRMLLQGSALRKR